MIVDSARDSIRCALTFSAQASIRGRYIIELCGRELVRGKELRIDAPKGLCCCCCRRREEKRKTLTWALTLNMDKDMLAAFKRSFKSKREDENSILFPLIFISTLLLLPRCAVVLMQSLCQSRLARSPLLIWCVFFVLHSPLQFSFKIIHFRGVFCKYLKTRIIIRLLKPPFPSSTLTQFAFDNGR